MLSLSRYSELSLDIARCLSIVSAIAAPVSTAATSIASTALLVFWLLSGQALRTLKISWQQPVGKMIVIFVAWLIMGTQYADTNLHVQLTTLSSWKKLFFVYVLLGLFTEQVWQKRFVCWYSISMFGFAVAGLVLWSLDLNVRPSNHGGPGIFMTNHATQSMAFVAAMLSSLFLLRDTDDRNKQWFIQLAIVLLLFNIFFISPARSGYLVVPVAVTFAAGTIYGLRKLPYIVATVVLALIVVGLTSTTLQDRIKLAMNEQASYHVSDKETSIGIRVIFYQNTLELIKKHPWFGYGTSSFESAYGALASTNNSGWRGGSTADPHNQYLFVWVENGLFGLLLFLTYIYTGIRQGLDNKPYGHIASSFLVAIATSSLFNSHFKTFPEGYLLAFFLGALLVRPVATQPNRI
jgi:O-antigen ligase